MHVVNVHKRCDQCPTFKVLSSTLQCCTIQCYSVPVLQCYRVTVLYNPAGLPAVLTAVVNVVNGSFRADAASSLIVTRGFMGNLPVNFSTYSNILRATLPMHCFPSKFKLSGKWPACNAIQHNTLPSTSEQ